MAIKIIDEIPQYQKSSNQRDCIRADIQEAIDKGIALFEFEGDYNYKYLAQYAREVARHITTVRARAIRKKFKEDNYTEEEKNIKGFYVWFSGDYIYKDNWIRIVTRKGDDRRRVFCSINDIKVLEDAVIANCKDRLAEARQKYQLIDGKWESVTK